MSASTSPQDYSTFLTPIVNNKTVVLLCDCITPRLSYVANHFLCKMIGFKELKIITHLPDYEHFNGIKINYSNHNTTKGYKWHACGLLQENHIAAWAPKITFAQNKIYFNNHNFDVLSAIFYLISRYEETEASKFNHDYFDTLGRFKAKHSLAKKHGFIAQPLVDIWANEFIDLISQENENVELRPRKFSYVPGFDVDMAFAFKHKNVFNTAKSIVAPLLKGNFKDFIFRLNVLNDQAVDPFNNYKHIIELHRKAGIAPIFFWLFGHYGGFDNNHSAALLPVQKTISYLFNNANLGIHPSIKSNASFSTLQSEFNEYYKITGKKPALSRQHFLCNERPSLIPELLQLGITQEYSMYYADEAGFRASTCTPYNWYDLRTEQELMIEIFPAAFMDATFNYYTRCNPTEATEYICQLANTVKDVKGTLVSVWHNNSYAAYGEWKGWENVYPCVLAHITKLL